MLPTFCSFLDPAGPARRPEWPCWKRCCRPIACLVEFGAGLGQLPLEALVVLAETLVVLAQVVELSATLRNPPSVVKVRNLTQIFDMT
jgi:hypothetical protein